MSKKISVCLATYNGEKFIYEQVMSILKQLPNEKDELLISDDGSTDGTVSIIKRINDSRITILTPNANNIVDNFESVLEKAKGDFIFIADQDDIWLNNKVNKMVLYLEEFNLVLSDCFIIDSDNSRISNSFFKTNRSRPGLIKNLVKNSYLGCSMAFDSKLLKEALPFPANIPMHDWWIGLIGEAFFKVKHLNVPLMNYRRHDNNASTSGERSKNSILTKAVNRFPLVLGLIGRMISRAQINFR